MCYSQEMKLEIISQRARGKANPTKLLFVHGICVGAWVWAAHFLPYFANAGFDSYALSLRGHAASEGHGGLLTWTLGDYTADVDEAVRTIGGPVIVIGHSLGGAVVQNWLRCGGDAKGAALLASVPPWGLGPSAWRMGMTAPRLFHEFSKMITAGVDSADPAIMRAALFSADLPDEAYETFMRRVQDESRIVSLELQGFTTFAPMPWFAPPMFVLGGRDDQLIPSDEVWKTAMYYGVKPTLIDGLAHSTMLDPHWKKAAEALRGWINTL